MNARRLLFLIPGFLAVKRKKALAGLAENVPSLSQEHREKIDQMMWEVRCRKDYECCKSGFTKLCPVSIIGPHKLIECLADDATNCGASVSLGKGTFCRCPVRRYIAENFDK